MALVSVLPAGSPIAEVHVSISDHVSSFAGLPVVNFELPDEDDDELPEPLPDDPASVAWRLALEDFEADAADFGELVEGWLERVPGDSVRALIIGNWGSAYEEAPPIDLLTALAPRLPGLRALFLGEMTFEECEISWICHRDITPLLAAWPGLEVLRVRGGRGSEGDGLKLSPVRHAALRELAFESGGLPASVVRAVGESELPELTHLELWLGEEEYGGDATIADLGSILAADKWPRLRHLALCDAEIADKVAAAVATAPVLTALKSLDLSQGTLVDADAEVLLSGKPLTHLRRLDLHHNYLSEPMAARFVAELPGVEVDLSDQQTEDEHGRYTAVSE
ncbi:hypothetical protein GCM10023322_57060 [Rugosimonospora acidiphila]|uniref:Leucine-rich repeat domain-containing protein n=1 Tax=Rugosimonospora acidiphila TaxID=556531 RepID=A0ABP9SD10_9ACTN